MVWTCYTSNRTCKHHHAGHSTKREETRQTKQMLARQHQGMDGAASRQDPETSRRQRRLEKDHQNICGAPTAPPPPPPPRLRAADAEDFRRCKRCICPPGPLASFPTSLSACSFPLISQCAGIHCWVRFVRVARSSRTVSTSLRSLWRGFWSLLRTERASVKMTTLGLVWGRLSLISNAAF